MKKKIRNLIVFGCGFHFRERYFGFLEKFHDHENLKINLVVDLENQKEKIQNFFKNKKILPEKYLFLPEKFRNSFSVEDIAHWLHPLINPQKIDGVIISSEPKAHKNYLLWAIQNNLPVFIDKPLTAFVSIHEKISLFQDYLDIIDAMRGKNLNVVISCERRANLGYQYLKQTISEIIDYSRIPITFIDIHFGAGKWDMPDEYFFLENHPYKYGYGTLLHSGYHYIDLFFSLVSLYDPIIPLSCLDIEFEIFKTSSFDSLNSVKSEVYTKLFHTDRFDKFFEKESLEKMKYFGETDLMIVGQLKKNSAVITNFCIKLFHTSLTKRSWSELPENLYRGNGRIRQESLLIHLGHVSSISMHSNPYSKLDKKTENIEDFSIEFMNNEILLKRDPYIQIKRNDLSEIYPHLDLYESLNVTAREWQLTDFLNGGDGNSPIASHFYTIKFIDMIYQRIKKQLKPENIKEAQCLGHQ